MTPLQDNRQYTSIHGWIEQQVIAAPDAIALIYDNQSYRYQTLNAQANQLARYLKTLGVKAEVLVGICMDKSPQLIVSILAVLKAGGAYVPIDPDYPQERIDLIVEDAQMPLLITEKLSVMDLFTSVEKAVEVICLEKDGQIIAQQCCENLALTTTASQLAYVIYTSGSTGKPKGVMVEHRTLINFVQSVGKAYQLSPADRVLQFASISFDIAVEEIFATLTHGAILVLRSPEMLRSSAAFFQACHDWQISVIDLPTAFWHKLCADLSEIQFSNALRLVIIGGERAVPQWLAVWKQHTPDHVRLVNTYGPTEATVVTTLCDLAGPHAVDIGESRDLPIGTPLTNVQTYVLNQALKPVASGAVGELYIGGRGLARGYLRHPEITAQSYVWVMINGQNRTRLYKTGDRVRQRADGHLEFLGRADNQEKIRGFRVELSEIEAALEQHHNVRQAIILAREDWPGSKYLVAYVVLNRNRSQHTLPQIMPSEVPSLRAYLQGKLPSYMVPSIFVLLESLPLSANGKVNRRALPAPPLERPTLTEAYIAPRTPLEITLAELYSKVLSIVAIGANDNFFDLGGNSLQTMELIAYVEKKYGVSVRLKEFLAMPSIAGIATLVNQNRADRKSPSEYMSLQQLQSEAAICWQALEQLKQLKQLKQTEQPTQTVAKENSTKDIFMTGATGFLGAFLLQALLRLRPTAKIYCLIRAHNAAEAQQKLRTALEKYFSAAEIPYHRLVPVVGNLTKPNLGLSAEKFTAIADAVGSIYHCGANVNMFYPYTALKSANVLGTQAVIRLAMSGSLKVLHYISTLDVWESVARTGINVFYENGSTAQGEGIAGGYAQSKWIAEQIVLRAAASGLPVCIYRPGMVTGHSDQGHSNTNDVLCRFIKSLIQLKAAPDLEISVDMTPVDYVSEAIAAISLKPIALGKVFHIVTPYPSKLSEIVTALQAKGYAIRPLPYVDWLHQLNTKPNEMSALAAFTAGASPEDQRTCLELWLGGHYKFDCFNVTQALAGETVRCLPADRQLLNIYLSYFVQSGFIPQAALSRSLAPF